MIDQSKNCQVVGLICLITFLELLNPLHGTLTVVGERDAVNVGEAPKNRQLKSESWVLSLEIQ